MRKNFGAKTWLYLEPVLILATYNEDGSYKNLLPLCPITLELSWQNLVAFHCSLSLTMLSHEKTPLSWSFLVEVIRTCFHYAQLP